MKTIIDSLTQFWPALLIFTVVLSAVRVTYLLCSREKIVLYKEILSLLFILYILVLFYLVTVQEGSGGTTNFVPFKEMFRYSFGSKLFIRNFVGNLLLFIPFGLFVSYYLNNHRMTPIFVLSALASLSIEITQSKIGRVFDIDDIILNVIGGIMGYLLFVSLDAIGNHLPRIFKSDWFKNIIVLIIIIGITFYFIKYNTIIFERLT